MDEFEAVRTLRRDLPEITPAARDAARHAFMNAAQAPGSRPRPKLRWRPALAAMLAVLAGTGVVMTRGQPETTPVAGVVELGERAARAAEDTPVPEARAGQWLYIKQRQAAISDPEGVGVDPGRFEDWEQWASVDGQRTAWYTDGRLLEQGTFPGLSADRLDAEPVTPQSLLQRISAALPDLQVTSGPPPSKDELRFKAIYQLMGEQQLPARVRAALFRALPMIPGVTVTQNAADAAGRHGVAFSHSSRDLRYDLILSPDDYRFLGTYGVTTADRTWDLGQEGKRLVKAGTPLTWTAQLETRLVDHAGDRP
ncbi:hypothetical protein Sru01_27630 [Sphaerisporangium rufum]|uniref:CU044_5270 family protein n=1 Tax=Sphaerisporangium rufum TaxID=1381558 RepID=A0A919R109_9ACTN|nr:CU044_5270 family protein [Sphaerisporangium rufum]GII77781.1 hypothetical protein Sru01_27630 [Sphaerisporangium rufum]